MYRDHTPVRPAAGHSARRVAPRVAESTPDDIWRHLHREQTSPARTAAAAAAAQ